MIRGRPRSGSGLHGGAGPITIFLVGLAVSQVFYGVLADWFGREPVLFTDDPDGLGGWHRLGDHRHRGRRGTALRALDPAPAPLLEV